MKTLALITRAVGVERLRLALVQKSVEIGELDRSDGVDLRHVSVEAAVVGAPTRNQRVAELLSRRRREEQGQDKPLHGDDG